MCSGDAGKASKKRVLCRQFEASSQSLASLWLLVQGYSALPSLSLVVVNLAWPQLLGVELFGCLATAFSAFVLDPLGRNGLSLQSAELEGR